MGWLGERVKVPGPFKMFILKMRENWPEEKKTLKPHDPHWVLDKARVYF